jgi:hypothetical protein
MKVLSISRQVEEGRELDTKQPPPLFSGYMCFQHDSRAQQRRKERIALSSEAVSIEERKRRGMK